MFGLLKKLIKPADAAQKNLHDRPTNTKKRSYDAANEYEYDQSEQDEPASNKAASPPVNDGDAVMAEEESSDDELDVNTHLKPLPSGLVNVSDEQRPAKRARSTSLNNDIPEAAKARPSAVAKSSMRPTAVSRGGRSPLPRQDEEESEDEVVMVVATRASKPGQSASTSLSVSQGQQTSRKGKERAVSVELEEEPARPASAMAKRTGGRTSTSNTAGLSSTISHGKAALSRSMGSNAARAEAGSQQKLSSTRAKSLSPILVQASLPSLPTQSQQLQRESRPILSKPPPTTVRPAMQTAAPVASTSKVPMTSGNAPKTTSQTSTATSGAPSTSSKAAAPPSTADSQQPWPPEAKYTSLQQLNNYTTKPPYFWWILGRAAILGAPGKKATMQDLAKAIVAKYPFYVEAKNSGALAKSLRAALHGKACFETHKTADKKTWYTVNESINPAINKVSNATARKSDASTLASTSLQPSASTSLAPAALVGGQASASTLKLTPEEELVNRFVKNLLANPPILPPLPPSEHQVFATSLTSLPSAEELFQTNLMAMQKTGATSISVAAMQRSNNLSDMGKLQKVPFPLFTLARAAILGSPHRKLRLEPIAKAILERYPQLSNPEKDAAFRRQLTQTLNKHKCFYRASDSGGFYQSSWMVDLQVDPRIIRHEPTANMNRKETAQHREAFSKACRDLADADLTALDTLIEELESHTAYYARSDERITARKESLALTMLGPLQTLPRLPTPPPPPKERTPSPELAEEPPRPRPSPSKSASRPTIRMPSPEIPIPPPSPARKAPTTMSIKGKSAALAASQIPPAPVRAAGTSSPEPLAFSGASSRRTSSLERTDSRDSRAAPPSSRTASQSQPVIVLSGDSDSDEDEDTTMLAPHSPVKLPYVCGYTDYKTALMCEESFADNDERLRHLRYEHGQIQAQYLVPRIPKAALAAVPKQTQKRKRKPAVRKAQPVKQIATKMARKQSAAAKTPAQRQQSLEV